MDGALAAFTAIVDAHRGKVLHYAGDSLLAAFGAAEAREDDAVQAVRCGLALLAESRRRAVRGCPSSASASACTPAMCCSAAVSTTKAPSAGWPSTSPRAWSRARPPAGCGSATTPTSCARHLRRRGAGTDHREGHRRAAVTYLVERARPRAFRVETRGIEGVATRMIGREAELGRLQQAFRSLLEARCLRRVTSSAKRASARAAAARVRRLDRDRAGTRAAASRGGRHRRPGRGPYGLLFDVIGWHFGIGEGDTTAWRNASSSPGSCRCSRPRPEPTTPRRTLTCSAT